MGRLWYGWKDFAQGGVNEAGLFFDGAVTPEQTTPEGYQEPNKNIGDDILATCRSIKEAIDYLETCKIALKNSHIFFGDSGGNAVVVEWIDGKKVVTEIKNNRLVATNFLLADTTKGNFPCQRYNAIQTELDNLDRQSENEIVSLKTVGNILAKAVQSPQKDSQGNEGGTLYSTFIDLTEMQLTMIYKLDNSKAQKFNLLRELTSGRKRKIYLE